MYSKTDMIFSDQQQAKRTDKIMQSHKFSVGAGNGVVGIDDPQFGWVLKRMVTKAQHVE